MTEVYKVGKDIYDIPEDKLEGFKIEFPEAEKVVEKVKENGVAETDASVTPEENTASILDPGSSVSTKIDNSKKAIIARRKDKALQPSSDPLDYANYDISSDSFIIPEELEEVVVTAPLSFKQPDFFGKKAKQKEEKKKSQAKKIYNDQVKAIGSITNIEYNQAAAKIYFDTSDKKSSNR